MEYKIQMGNTLEESSYHEAGHIVIASALGLALRPMGIEVYETPERLTEGIAHYWDDYETEDVLCALVAGEMAQVKRFPLSCRLGSIEDGKKFKEALKVCFGENRSGEVRDQIYERAEKLLDTHWSAIIEVADSVIRSKWIDIEKSHPFIRKKHLDGNTLAIIIKKFGISSTVREATDET